MTHRAIMTVKELREDPRLGGLRIQAALRQQGIFLDPRNNGGSLTHPADVRAIREEVPGAVHS